MTKENNIEIIPSDLRRKFAPKRNQSVPIYLEQRQQEFVETDRSVGVNLLQLYDDERQRSTIFRPTFKLNFVFENVYTGITQYKPFENQLYYVDVEETIAECFPNWKGYPQYKEFDFIREDYNVSGYTTKSGTTDPHVNFETKKSTNYNWSLYLSYPYKNLTNIQLYYYNDKNILQNNWISEQGIPFIIKNRKFNGRNIISFICPTIHNLNLGESIQIVNFDYNGQKIFAIDSLGDETFGSESFICNIANIGYTGTTFLDNVIGTFKRVINPANSADTTSKYYVREHKIITSESEFVLNKSGFELNGFNSDIKYQYSVFTPGKTGFVSEREGNKTYTINFNRDIDVNGLVDNQKRPITDLYLSIVNKGFFGWFNNPTGGQQKAIKFGFDFNINDVNNNWWANTNLQSIEPNISVDTYNKPPNFNFYYNRSLNIGDVIYGDFCEWNDYEQTETVISNINHKIRFNPQVFEITTPPKTNPDGYYYKVHHPMKLRYFSTYVETASSNQKNVIPDYCYFSNNEKEFRWRDIYTYGFIDETNTGVDYPFLNGAHYPFTNVIFKLAPEGYINYTKKLNLIEQPQTDDCETI